MDVKISKLTVFFEKPFWVGVFERIEDGKLSASKVTFGAEPKDYEVYEFILLRYHALKFSPAVAAVEKELKKNPKRLQRELKKQLAETGIGTKSQQALQLQREATKLQRRRISKAEKEAERQRQFDLKQWKRKEKHRGR